MRLILVTLIFITVNGFAQTLDYVKHINSNSQEIPTDLVIDRDGNTYIGGYFNDRGDFDPGPAVFEKTSNGLFDCFLMKLDINGNLIWVQTFGGLGEERLYGLGLDNAGDIYATGGFSGTVDFDPGLNSEIRSSNGEYDVFVIKFDKQGNFEHVTTVGGAKTDIANSVSIDNSKNVYISGEFQDTVNFDPTSSNYQFAAIRSATNFQTDGFLLALDSNQNTSWAKQSKANNTFSRNVGFDVEVGNSQRIYLVNTINGGTGFNLSKLNPNGSESWSIRLNSFGILSIYNIEIDNNEDIVVVGTLRGQADFDPSSTTAIVASSSRQGIIAKYSQNGDFLWVKTFESKDNRSKGSETYDVTTDGDNNILVTGYFYGKFDFDPGTDSTIITSNGFEINQQPFSRNDIFLACYDKSGNYIWAKGIGNAGANIGIAIKSFNNSVQAVGYFSDTINADPKGGSSGVLVNNRTRTDGYILKWTNCIPSFSSILVNGCNDYTLPSGKKVISSGIYKDTTLNSIGCDSIITANITIRNLDTTVSRLGARFIANLSGAFYQWVNCNLGYYVIDGETDQDFTPKRSGSFAVIILKDNCSDTSSCFTTVGLSENELLNSLSISPNPTTDNVSLNFDEVQPTLSVEIQDINGKIILFENYQNVLNLKLPIEGASGLYFVKLATNEGQSGTIKILKE